MEGTSTDKLGKQKGHKHSWNVIHECVTNTLWCGTLWKIITLPNKKIILYQAWTDLKGNPTVMNWWSNTSIETLKISSWETFYYLFANSQLFCYILELPLTSWLLLTGWFILFGFSFVLNCVLNVLPHWFVWLSLKLDWILLWMIVWTAKKLRNWKFIYTI